MLAEPVLKNMCMVVVGKAPIFVAVRAKDGLT